MNCFRKLCIVTMSCIFMIGCTKEENIQVQSSNLPIATEKSQVVYREVNYENCFDGIQGCAVFYNDKTKEYQIYNKELALKQASPCSTFKIVSTLMGLENGVVDSIDSKMGYNGIEYPFGAWNKDLGLKEAFQSSCVWYFKKVVDKVGKEEVQKEINELSYGNGDISEWDGSGINDTDSLNGFWLEASLKISPMEQVQCLAKIFSGQSRYSQKDITLLKQCMLVEDVEKQNVYGKTGTGYSDNAWFVGILEEEKDTYYFAVRLNQEENQEKVKEKGGNATGAKAKAITLKIIKQYFE